MATAIKEVTRAGPDVLKQCELVPHTFSEEETVWIGFMDIVPVIGTLRESVELVLAVYEGNEAVVKEKEKAIENIVKGSPQKHVRKGTVPVKPAGDEYSGLLNVREVRVVNIIECMGKGSKTGQGTKPLTSAEQKERQKKLEVINKDMLEKMHLVNPNFKLELKEQLERSKRGEHVFNNGLLRFHSNVLTAFKQHNHIDNLRGYNQQAMDELGRHTLSPITETEIRTNMVVHFSEKDFYVNANGVMYGRFSQALCEAMLVVLNHINPDDVTPAETQRVIDVIDLINNLQIYVDEPAKQAWIGNNASRRNRFELVRQQVATMYNTDRGFDWCIRILREVAPLFVNRQ